MSLNVYKGKITEIGQGVTHSGGTNLSYIQFADGTIVKRISAVRTMNSKLSFAVANGEEIEIFTVKMPTDVIIGVKTQDERVYLAQGVPSDGERRKAQFTHTASICLIIVGVPLIAFVGAGLFLIYMGFTYKLRANFPARRTVWTGLDELVAQYPEAIAL